MPAASWSARRITVSANVTTTAEAMRYGRRERRSRRWNPGSLARETSSRSLRRARSPTCSTSMAPTDAALWAGSVWVSTATSTAPLIRVEPAPSARFSRSRPPVRRRFSITSRTPPTALTRKFLQFRRPIATCTVRPGTAPWPRSTRSRRPEPSAWWSICPHRATRLPALNSAAPHRRKNLRFGVPRRQPQFLRDDL